MTDKILNGQSVPCNYEKLTEKDECSHGANLCLEGVLNHQYSDLSIAEYSSKQYKVTVELIINLEAQIEKVIT